MPDKVQKTFVSSFIAYLKKQVDSQTLTPDAQESVEVAIQCLEAAFEVGDDSDDVPPPSDQPAAAAAAATAASAAGASLDKNFDLFELFQSMYIERNPASLQMAEAIKNEGNRLMKDGKYNEALLQYNRAITFDPKNPIFYCNRAAAYIRLGDNEHAVTDCKSALVYNTAYGKAYGRLGIAYSNLGKYEEAQQAYAKAIELEPENEDYRNNMEVARNARNQVPPPGNVIPQLQEGINTMLSNPAVRNLFSGAEIDLNQLQNMAQNPAVNAMMQTISQMFVAPGGGGGGGGAPGAAGIGVGAMPEGMPPLSGDMLQLFQSFATQLSDRSGQPPRSGNDGNAGANNQQPPPPSSS